MSGGSGWPTLEAAVAAVRTYVQRGGPRPGRRKLAVLLDTYDRRSAELHQLRDRLLRPDPGPGAVDTPDAIRARMDEVPRPAGGTEHRLAAVSRAISAHLPVDGPGEFVATTIVGCGCGWSRDTSYLYGGQWAWHVAHALDDDPNVRASLGGPTVGRAEDSSPAAAASGPFTNGRRPPRPFADGPE